ncbi:MAG TPA: ABC transporter substrate-binding protein [Mycobacteriales bacterium]|nr:ABC transporter substrate-binding protein [Mycobacteriales bacterium]
MSSDKAVTMPRSLRAVLAAVALVAPLVLAACGTRVPRAEVIAGAGGGPVTIGGGGVVAGPATGAPSAAAPGAVIPTAAGSTAAAPGGAVAPVGGGPTVSVPGVTTPASAQPTTGPAAPSGGVPATSSRANTPGQPCTKQGSTIVFGQVGTFSGIIGASIGAAQPVLKAWAQATNAAGGIACHPVQVISIDDAGDAGKAQSAVQSLIQSSHAVAINAFVPVTFNGIRSTIDDTKVPVVGGDITADEWNQDPNFFPEGTSFESAIFAFMKYAAQSGGHKFSYLQCIEATPCSVARKWIEKNAAAAGLQEGGVQPISLAGSNFTQQCQTAKNQGDDVMFVGAGATANTAVARDCANQNYHPIFATIGLGANNALEDDPNEAGLTLGLPTFPWMLGSTPAEAAYQAALQRYAPNIVTSGGGAQGWTSGELLKKAILNLGQAAYGTITPAMIVQGLHMMKNETLGGLAPNGLTFPDGQPATPVKCSFIAQIKGGKWSAPLGNNQVCGP